MLRTFDTDTDCDSSPDMEVSHNEDDNSEDNTHTQDAYRCFIEQDEDDYYMQEDDLTEGQFALLELHVPAFIFIKLPSYSANCNLSL